MRIERVRTNGIFSLDGEDFDVESAFHKMEQGDVLRSVVVL